MDTYLQTVLFLFIPFFGTALGAALALFMKREFPERMSSALSGFASGVMIAASVWSLLVPAIEMAGAKGGIPWLAPAAGFLAGMGFLLLIDMLLPHLHANADRPEGPASKLRRSSMLLLAVTIHNLPEGMAVGVILAGLLSGSAGITASAALAVTLGIALQNVPEGAIVSMPLRSSGKGRGRAFLSGVLSGAVEPVGGALTILLTSLVLPVLPFVLSFAAGAMIYVVLEELVPEMHRCEHSNAGAVAAALGFALMMVLDVALG